LVSAHDAMLLLKSSFSAPKLQNVLRSAPCDGHQLLESFDSILRSALCAICNASLTEEQWIQASLPVRAGALGVRRVSSLTSSAFLASAADTRDLQDKILHVDSSISDDYFGCCLHPCKLDKQELQLSVGAEIPSRGVGTSLQYKSKSHH
jgi:hypothetical protein